MRMASSAVRFRELLTAAHIDHFLPMTKKVVTRAGKEETIETPLLFSYIFVRSDELTINEFCTANDGIAFLREHTPDGTIGPHLVVPEIQMRSFIQAVEQYTEDIPFIAPTPEMLTKGDRVRIIGGPFRGIVGLLESHKGKDGGRVIVRIGNLIAIPTVEISAEFIEVLEFAPEGRHLYQKLDSFQPRLYRAVELRETGEPVPPELIGYLQIFTRRFANLTVSAINAKARFLSYLMLAYAVIERDDKHSSPILTKLTKLKPLLKSKQSIRLVENALFRTEKLNKMKKE